MENQHRKIKGYRELSQEEIDLMNEIKAHFAATDELIRKVNALNEQLRVDGVDTSKSEPFRWSAMAKTSAQLASMELTRAVAKPEFF